MTKPREKRAEAKRPERRDVELRALSEQFASISLEALYAARRAAELAKGSN